MKQVYQVCIRIFSVGLVAAAIAFLWATNTWPFFENVHTIQYSAQEAIHTIELKSEVHFFSSLSLFGCGTFLICAFVLLKKRMY